MKQISIIALLAILVMAGTTSAQIQKWWIEFTDANGTHQWGDANNWADLGNDVNYSPWKNSGPARLPKAWDGSGGDANYALDSVLLRNAVNGTIANGVAAKFGGSCIVGGSEYRDPNNGAGSPLWRARSTLLVQAGGSLDCNMDVYNNKPSIIVGDWYDGEMTNYGNIATHFIYVGNRAATDYYLSSGVPDPDHAGWQPRGTFFMMGGSITTAVANPASQNNPRITVGGYNGGVGSFRMEDGLITYKFTDPNAASSGKSFAIYVGGDISTETTLTNVSKGTFEMVGGQINTPQAAINAGLDAGQGVFKQTGGSVTCDNLSIGYNRTDSTEFYNADLRGNGKYIMTGGTLNFRGTDSCIIGQNNADGLVDANNALIQIRGGNIVKIGSNRWKTGYGEDSNYVKTARGTFNITNTTVNGSDGVSLVLGFCDNQDANIAGDGNCRLPATGLLVMNSGSLNLGLANGSFYPPDANGHYSTVSPLINPRGGSAVITLGSFRYPLPGGTLVADPNTLTGIMSVKGGSVTTKGDIQIAKNAYTLGSLYVSKNAYFKSTGTFNMYPDVSNKKSVLEVDFDGNAKLPSTMLNIGTGKLSDKLIVNYTPGASRPGKEGDVMGTLMTAAFYNPYAWVGDPNDPNTDPNDPNWYHLISSVHREGGFLKDANGNYYGFSTITQISSSGTYDANHGYPTGKAIGGKIIGGDSNDANSHDYYVYVFDGLTGGDASGDHKVNIVDLGVLSSKWNNVSGTMTWQNADFSGDGKVNIVDLGVLSSNWGWTKPGSAPAPGGDIPEPATLALISLGALSMIRRRKT